MEVDDDGNDDLRVVPVSFVRLLIACEEDIGQLVGDMAARSASCLITDKMFRGPSEKKKNFKVFELCSTHMPF